MIRKIISGAFLATAAFSGLTSVMGYFSHDAGQAMPMGSMMQLFGGIACLVFLLIGVLIWPWGEGK